MTIEIRRADVGEAEFLSDLAIRSKGHWGYSAEFLESCRAELTVEPEHMLETHCFVAVDQDAILGFYSLDELSTATYELDALFVEPGHMGRGVGRALVNHAVARVADQGATTMVIQGDPNAADFYRSVGARHVGERESGSIPGRYLPLFEIDIVQGRTSSGEGDSQ